MLSLLPVFSLAQLIIPAPAPTPTPIPPLPPVQQQLMVQPQEVRALPGQLDKVLVFNSNSPEVIKTEGILLSTFPTAGKAVPSAHLNFPLKGRFDLFAHHIRRTSTPGEARPMYLGVIVYNPGNRPVKLDILQAVSHVTNPDAPFIELPSYVDNSTGKVYSGPGSRAMNDIMRGVHQSNFPSQIVIPPKRSQMLFNLPMWIGNTRTTLMRLQSSDSVYVASLAGYGFVEPSLEYDPTDLFFLLYPPPPPIYRGPTLDEWQKLLDTGGLAGPRDRTPTRPEATNTDIVYGRVAGVAQGSEWRTEVTDRPGTRDLSIPQQGKAFSYPLSTVPMITLGTGQVQSAPLLVRYADTAYRAHGNYGVRYSLTLPLLNNTPERQTVTLTIQTPVKQENQRDELRFLEPPDPQVFFRGTVQVSYNDDQGIPQTRYLHLVQRRGQQGEPLVTLNMLPGDRRLVKVDFLYPPDSQPPQALTVKTLERSP